MTRLPSLSKFPALARRAAANREGSATIWAIYWTIALVMVGGIAVDASNAFGYKSRLQKTADASAVAAAMKLPDTDAALLAAKALAEINMPASKHGTVIRDQDVVFGTVDDDTGEFVALQEGEDAEAVRIYAGRDEPRANSVPTYLIRLAGIDDWNVDVTATAATRFAEEEGGGGGGGDPEEPEDYGYDECYSVLILTQDELNLGGGNHYREGVCVHGTTKVQPGGGDCFEVGTRISAPDKSLIGWWWNAANQSWNFDHKLSWNNSCKNGEEPESMDELIVERDPEFPMLDKIEAGLFETTWNAVLSHTKFGLYSQGDELPDFVSTVNGRATVYVINADWKPGQNKNGGTGKTSLPDLKEHAIYLVDGDVSIKDKQVLRNVAILATGKLQSNGQDEWIAHDNIFLFTKGRLGLGGKTAIGGEVDAYCEGGYTRAYLLSEDSIQLAGFPGNDSTTGIVATMLAAPTVNWGGSMASTGGLYVEAANKLTTGGDIDLTGCTKMMSSIYGQNPFAPDGVLAEATEIVDNGTSNVTVAAGADIVR